MITIPKEALEILISTLMQMPYEKVAKTLADYQRIVTENQKKEQAPKTGAEI